METLTDKMLQRAISRAKTSIGIIQEHMAYKKEGEATRVKFKIVEIIGVGTFGLLSKIICQGTVRALKTVYEDSRYVNRETDLLLEISHPNIVNLYAYYTTGATRHGMYRHLILEYVPVILEDMLCKGVGIDVLRMLYRQALEALDYLHKKGICHRDIKPSNILVDNKMNLKVCDFGTAKYLKEGSNNITYICSRYYRAPENIFGYEQYTNKIDIWAIALVFTEFGLPEPLFKAPSADAMVQKIFSLIEAEPAAITLYGCAAPSGIKGKGLRETLRAYFQDEDLLDVFESSLQIDFRRRPSAEMLLQMPFFKHA